MTGARMKTARWTSVIVIVLMFGAIALYFVLVRSYYRRISPLPQCTIEQLSARVGLGRWQKCQRNGSVFYLAEGQLPPGFVLASGPPVYVFDSEGMLVEWFDDSGDEPSGLATWRGPSCEDVTLKQVLDEVGDLRRE